MVAALAATALGLALSTGTAVAASRSGTDDFTFTNRAADTVPCTVDTVQELSETGLLSVSTTLSGPEDCTASRLSIYVEYRRRSDGTGQWVSTEGEGRFLSATFDDVASRVGSQHSVYLSACDCGAVSRTASDGPTWGPSSSGHG